MTGLRKSDTGARHTVYGLLVMSLGALMWIIGNVTDIGAIKSIAAMLFIGGFLWIVLRNFRDFI